MILVIDNRLLSKLYEVRATLDCYLLKSLAATHDGTHDNTTTRYVSHL